jgi:hypothetical protein
MSIYPTINLQRYVVLAAIVMTLAGDIFTPQALARIMRNTVDMLAYVTGGGRQLMVTGPIAGDVPGEVVHLEVTVTQRTTGAVARGQTFLTLAGGGPASPQQWQIQASTLGNETFEPGPATVVAIATTSNRGVTSDAHQWLVQVTLVGR